MSGLALLNVAITVAMSACPVDALFAQYAGAHPGANVAVIKDGAILFEKSYGLANVETGERVVPETNFRLASVTKQFTATAIALLAERGKLSLDDKVVKYLPELDKVVPETTLRQLLTHTSGLPEYEALLAKDETDQIVDRDVVALVAKLSHEVKPSRKFVYNNTGYALLAVIVERVSKLAYPEFLHRNIFAPLAMTTTLAYEPKATIAHRALGYPNDQNRTTAVLGDGGIYSSTRDLVRWIDALDHHTLLPATRLAESTSALVATEVPGLSYGLGWRIEEHRGEKLVWHTGTTSGFKNALVWVPSRKLAVVVLTNRRAGEPIILARAVLDQYWDR
ncbi:MAG: serine hydrolase domain-containing protein [Kofleriaceae bacterium]